MPISDDQLAALWRDARGGDHRAIGRLLTLIETDEASPNPPPGSLSAAHPTMSIGVTGAPGVGKSTLVAALITKFRDAKKRTAVIAVDPTSPISGGALLGDRVRMGGHTSDPGVFIRSMATRGQLGGLAQSTENILAALSNLGFDLVVIETVGVGQSEVTIASVADITIVVLAPGAGDSVQFAKAGLIEVADIFVLNKSDKGGTAHLARELSSALNLGDDSLAPIFEVSAADGTGLDVLSLALLSRQAQ
jgi:LAO/AO transport system kinase